MKGKKQLLGLLSIIGIFGLFFYRMIIQKNEVSVSSNSPTVKKEYKKKQLKENESFILDTKQNKKKQIDLISDLAPGMKEKSEICPDRYQSQINPDQEIENTCVALIDGVLVEGRYLDGKLKGVLRTFDQYRLSEVINANDGKNYSLYSLSDTFLSFQIIGLNIKNFEINSEYLISMNYWLEKREINSSEKKVLENWQNQFFNEFSKIEIFLRDLCMESSRDSKNCKAYEELKENKPRKLRF